MEQQKEQNKFGLFLKELRQKAGIPQQRLASELRLDQTYISKLETGTRVPTLNVIKAFSAYFRVDPSIFFDLAFPPQESPEKLEPTETGLKEKIAVTG